MQFPLFGLEQWRDSIYSRIVDRVGTREYWDQWAADVARMSEAQIVRIMAILAASTPQVTAGFEAFLEAILDPKHPDHEDAAQWHLSCYGKPFVPDEIDEPDAKRKITSIAKRRIASKSVKTRKPT